MVFTFVSLVFQNGEVQVFDAVNLKAVAVIPAHDSPLAALAFNSTGTKLASAFLLWLNTIVAMNDSVFVPFTAHLSLPITALMVFIVF